MMAQTHSRTSEAAVFVTTGGLMAAYPALIVNTWLPQPIKEWLLVPAPLHPRLDAVYLPGSGIGKSVYTGLTGVEATARDIGALFLTLLFIWAIANFAGLLPDIDTPSSRSANLINEIGEDLGVKKHGPHRSNALLLALIWLLDLIPGAFSWFANKFMGGHRGIVHSLPFTLLISFAFGALTKAIPFIDTPFYGTLFAVAFATHLLVDSVTRLGVKPLAPFTHWRFHLLPFGLALETSSEKWNVFMQVVAVLITVWAFAFQIIPNLLG